jgi:hypothetical protein
MILYLRSTVGLSHDMKCLSTSFYAPDSLENSALCLLSLFFYSLIVYKYVPADGYVTY